MDGFDVLDTLKNSPAHMVLVQDEYGELLGIVTTADILEAIVGAFQFIYDVTERLSEHGYYQCTMTPGL